MSSQHLRDLEAPLRGSGFSLPLSLPHSQDAFRPASGGSPAFGSASQQCFMDFLDSIAASQPGELEPSEPMGTQGAIVPSRDGDAGDNNMVFELQLADEDQEILNADAEGTPASCGSHIVKFEVDALRRHPKPMHAPCPAARRTTADGATTRRTPWTS